MSKYLTMLLGAVVAFASISNAEASEKRFITPVRTSVTSVEGAPDPVGERASRVGLLDVDFGQLYDPGREGKPVSVPIPGRTLEIELFPDEVYSLTGFKSTQSGDVWSWGASVDGLEGAEAMLTFDGASVYGTLNTPEHSFTILPDGEGQIWVRENDPAQKLGDEPIPTPQPTEITPIKRRPLTPLLAGSDTLDVAVLFTAAAASSYPTFSVVSNGAASADASFANSSVSGNVNIVGYQLSTYTEANPMDPGEQDTVVNAMKNGTGDFTGLATWRSNLKADIVILVYDSSLATTACASSFALLNPAGAPTYAVSVMGDGCIGSWQQFTHELGHIMGGQHDFPTGCFFTPFTYIGNLCCWATTGADQSSHGYTNFSPDFRDIMGSDNGCQFSSCTRQNRWSTSTGKYMGLGLGVAGESDMQAVLETNLCVSGGTLSLIADYETAGGSAPGQPGTFNVTSLTCNGINDLDWGASSGTVGWYEVEWATNSGYTTGVQAIYRGSDAGLTIDVPGTRYVRVKACNGAGCSSWRNGANSATVYPGCP